MSPFGILAFAALAATAAVTETTLSPQATPDSGAIQATLADYVKAVETKDVALFKKVKPNLSPEEERRMKAAFDSVKSHAIQMTVKSISVHGNEATVQVARRDTLNGSIVSSFTQVFRLLRGAQGWTILEMGR